MARRAIWPLTCILIWKRNNRKERKKKKERKRKKKKKKRKYLIKE